MFIIQTLLGIREAAKILEKENASYYSQPDYSNFLVLSLGTGSSKKQQGHQIGRGGLLDWLFSFEKGLSPLFDVMSRASDDMVDIYTSLILGNYNSHYNYLRIQVLVYTLKYKYLFVLKNLRGLEL